MKTYLRLLKYARPYWGKVVFYTIFTLISVVFTTLTFYLLQPVLELLFTPDKHPVNLEHAPSFRLSNEFLLEWVQYHAADISVHIGKSSALLYVTMFVVIMNLMGNFFKFLSNRYLGTIRTRVIEDLREDTYSKMVNLEVAYVENQRKGDIVSRVTADISEVEYSVVVTFESIIRDPLYVIYVLATMLFMSWQLTLFIFLVLPLSSILIQRISKGLKKNAADTQNIYGRIMSIVDETLLGARIIKAFNAESYIKQMFDKLNRRYSRLTRIQWHKKALVPVFSESGMVFVVGLTLWYGGNQVYAGQIKAAEFIAYLAMFFLLSRPAKSLSQAFGNIYKGLASGERIFELMDSEVIIKDNPAAISKTSFDREVEIRNLSFAYIKDFVLKDINLKIEKGKIYALVGPSGGGKSTLAELVLRFYDPTEGAILIDGLDLRDIKLSDLRSLTAVVTQEAILFNDSIYNNIAFGMPHVTREQVEQAAKAANAHEFIMESEQGYDTQIGDRGGLLSGGQRQRLSIARAVLKNPAILILDEATSALDTSSEKIVQDALSKLMANRTSIVIAHRLSTIQDADQIIVIEKGVIAEQGTHSELIAKAGIYTNLYKLQQLEA